MMQVNDFPHAKSIPPQVPDAQDQFVDANDEKPIEPEYRYIPETKEWQKPASTQDLFKPKKS